MSQSQVPSTFRQDGDIVDYTPAAAVYAGDIILLGSMVAVAKRDIAANVKGSLALDDTVTRSPKDASVFSAGDPVYWNPTGNPTGGTAGTGCMTSTEAGNYFAGTAMAAQLTGDATVDVKLLGFAQRNAEAGRDPINTAITTVGAGVLTAAGLVGGVITRSGPVAAYSDTTATAALIAAAMPGAPIGQAWYLVIKNTVAFPQTIVGGVGVTVSGNSIIPHNSAGVFLVTLTGAATVTMVGLYCVTLAQFVPEVSTALNTVGAGVISGAGIAGQFTPRGGAQAGAGFTDTTDTGANIAAAQPNLNIGQAWEWTYQNNTNAPATLTGGVGVTVSAITIVPQNCYARFLVTYTALNTFTIVGMEAGPNTVLPSTQFTSVAAGNGTLAAGNIEGADKVILASSGATAFTTRTAAQMIAQIPNAQVGMSYFLRVYNTNAGTLTLTGGVGVTITGTATIATAKYRDYSVTITGAATITLQNLGSGTAD